MNMNIERDWEAAALKIIANMTKDDIPRLNYVMNKICEFMHNMQIQEISFTTQYGLIECNARTENGELILIGLPTGTNGIHNRHDTVIQYFNVNGHLIIMNFNHFKKDLGSGAWLLDDNEHKQFVELWENY